MASYDFPDVVDCLMLVRRGVDLCDDIRNAKPPELESVHNHVCRQLTLPGVAPKFYGAICRNLSETGDP